MARNTKAKKVKSSKPKKFFILANKPQKLQSFSNRYNCKANIHNCEFVDCKITNVNFRGAIVTQCNFRSAKLTGVDFIGTNLRQSRFKNAHLNNVIFCGAKLDGCDFSGATFDNVILVNTNLDKTINIPQGDSGITILKSYPTIDISDALSSVLKQLASFPKIYKSHTLHTTMKKVNSLSLYLLLQKFSDDKLIRGLSALSKRRDKRNFHTLYSIEIFLKSYLKM